jgi:iron complex outermembrane receptor protein
MQPLLFAATSGLLLTLCAPSAGAQEMAQADLQTVNRLRNLSIEQLAQIEVVSVSKRPESLGEAPAATFVIMNEDIARSGATSLPEVLRLAPNLQVQQVDSRQFSISARGFNSFENANKLLVLIDGRTIYTPLASSVYWDLHEPLLQDVERVEVVSGPGGTLYGPNAVNGVVNILSRSAYDTLGGYARLSVGTEDRRGALRYGGRVGAAALRAYVTAFEREDSRLPSGARASDSWEGVQGGFRLDLGEDTASRFTLQGDIFDSKIDLVSGDGNKGYNLLARWQRELGVGSALQVQAYYDKFERRFTRVFDAVETYDLEVRHNLTRGRHDMVWGGGVRVTRDEFRNRLNPFVLDPEERELTVGNLFAQDRIALSERLDLIAGLKLERTSFTGVEVLPNLRLAWKPDERMLLWSAVSRAVRTPSRIDRQLVATGILAPNPHFKSEMLTAFEAGYRGQPSDSLSLSVSLFYNLYDRLRTTEPASGSVAALLPVQLANGLEADSYGAELWGTWQAAPGARLSAGLFLFGKERRFDAGVVDITGGESAGHDPRYQAQLRAQFDLAEDLDLDLRLRAADRLPEVRGLGGPSLPRVPAYAEADARLAWRPTHSLELAVSGVNLLHNRHAESFFRPPVQEMPRSVRVESRLSF